MNSKFWSLHVCAVKFSGWSGLGSWLWSSFEDFCVVCLLSARYLAVFRTSCKADTEDGNETESQTGNSRHRCSVPERYRERDFHEQCASFFVLPVPFYLAFREIFSALNLVLLSLISSAKNPLLIELMLLR